MRFFPMMRYRMTLTVQARLLLLLIAAVCVGTQDTEVETEVVDDDESPFCNKSRPFYCPHHIACITKWAMPCTDTLPLPESLAGIIVEVHNDCRSRATRPHPNAPPQRFRTWPRMGTLPIGSGLMLMSWDEELAALASLWVVSCAVEAEAINKTDYHMKTYESTIGNPYMYVVNAAEDTLAHRFKFCFDVSRFKVNGWLLIRQGYTDRSRAAMFSIWRDVLWEFCGNASRNMPEYIIESYRPEYMGLGASYPEGGVCMLWGNAARVGCGHRHRILDDSSVPQFEALACLYGPAPLRMGERVYEVGPPGTSCPPDAPPAASRWVNLCIPMVGLDVLAPLLVPLIVGIMLAGASYYVALSF